MTNYEKKQFDLCYEWFLSIRTDYVEDGETVQRYNEKLGRIMTAMERAFDIPLLDADFVDFRGNYPDIADLYSEISNARQFDIYPDAEEDSFKLDSDDDSGQPVPSVEVSIEPESWAEPYVIIVYNKWDLCRRVGAWLADYTLDDLDISFKGSIDALPDS